MKIYMAGPLFTAAERGWNREMARCLRDLGETVLLPQEFAPNVGTFQFRARDIFAEDVSNLYNSEVVVAWLEGPDPDSGTCWEVGRAKGSGIPVIGYTTDLRFQKADFGPYDLNLMLTCGVDMILRCGPDESPEEIALKIKGLLVGLKKNEKAKSPSQETG